MTVREFNILYKLLSYPRKTFTRQQLMDEFWDAESETAPRAVDVYMTKLRGKLADCEDFEIKTVHGLGYKAVLRSGSIPNSDSDSLESPSVSFRRSTSAGKGRMQK